MSVRVDLMAEANQSETHVGYFYTWWRGDPLPDLEPIPGFELRATDDASLLERLSDLSLAELRERIERGHQPYLALIDGEPAAYGWSAWKRAEIGELGVDFALPEGDRYLWDFVTLPDYRGMGIYPHMLQGIIRAEETDAERFWIGHDVDNVASARGIEKAGLPVIGEVWLRDGEPVYVGREPRERAEMAAERLKLPFEMTA
jgi:GNAT superfamily N-acetyltransferase